MRRTLIFTIITLGVIQHSQMFAAPTKSAKSITICTLPMGPHNKKLLTYAEEGVKWLYGFTVKRLKPVKLPKMAYYKPRNRYRAGKLLSWIDAKALPGSGCDIIIGFTGKDISTTKGKYHDWGILGLGSLGGTSAMVSTFRCKKGTKSARHVAIRTVKLINHELGHVLGLYHCKTDACTMMDAEGTVKTLDKESGLLCDTCRKKVEKRFGIVLPDYKTFDWSAVIP